VKILNKSFDPGYCFGLQHLGGCPKQFFGPEEQQTIKDKQETTDRELAECTANLTAIREEFDEEGEKETAVESPEDLSLQVQDARKRRMNWKKRSPPAWIV